MKKSLAFETIKKVIAQIDEGLYSFDYPIQRPSEQWSLSQKSLLINSILMEFPIPELYTTGSQETDGEDEEQVFYVLDGKQRMTTISDYIKGKFALEKDAPKVKIGKKEFEVGGLLFSEQDQKIQDTILDYSLNISRLDGITDEEIEELFFRLNNGTPLTKQHQSKAKMGKEWAKIISDMMNHEVFDIAGFTPNQKKRADDEVALLQTVMMSDEEYDYNSVSASDIAKYSSTFETGDEKKIALFESLNAPFDYIFEAFNETEKFMLKKVHFPSTVNTAKWALANGVSKQVFNKWRFAFQESYGGLTKGAIKTSYKSYCGQGSVKKTNALKRNEEMLNHLKAFVTGDEIEKFDKRQEEKRVMAEKLKASKEEVKNKAKEEKAKAKETTKVEEPVAKTTKAPVVEDKKVEETKVPVVDKKVEEKPVAKTTKAPNRTQVKKPVSTVEDGVSDDVMDDLLKGLE